MHTSASFFILLIFAMTFAGCVITHKTGTDTKPHLYPSFTVNGDISIINSQKRQYQTINLDGSTCTVDLIEIVDSAKQSIENQLKVAKSTNNADQNKSIGLSISNIHVTGIFKVTIHVKITLGNGISRGVEAKGKSFLINNAIDNATYNISDKVLFSIDVLNYIEK